MFIRRGSRICETDFAEVLGRAFRLKKNVINHFGDIIGTSDIFAAIIIYFRLFAINVRL